jgi:centrosomal protein CEP104
MNDLATVHSENEDFDRALTLYERALAIQRAALGDAHPETVQTLTDLAICHLDRDENDLGKPLLERALGYQEAILGPNHADVGAIRDVLASLDGGVR